jgi:2-C-methyl-D-erythritol 4-phosphate cytidylyltransferase/2-C-methyl-D-erythritol 2,4-cyclodiphosphate synthase
VTHALALLTAGGYRVVNADLTLLCESPRLAPHRDAIRSNVARLLQVADDAVNLKATTTEQLGFLGRAEGIAAMASVLIERG